MAPLEEEVKVEKMEHRVHQDIQEKVVILEVKVLKAMLVFPVTKEDQENSKRFVNMLLDGLYRILLTSRTSLLFKIRDSNLSF